MATWHPKAIRALLGRPRGLPRFPPRRACCEVLADSEELIRRQLDGEPEVEAEVRLTLGMLYRRLGDTKNAEPHLRNAVELFRRTRSEDEPRALRAKLELASLWVLYLEDLDEAELLIQDVSGVLSR